MEAIDAHKFNWRLRRMGMKPSASRLFPGDNRVKSLDQRAVERLERAVGR